MTTFLTDTMKKGYTQEEIFAVLFEAEQDRKRRRMQAIVTENVDAHRLRKMRDLLALEKLATWRRINGFDRVVDGEDNWFHGHRSLPPTPQEYTASLMSELQALKNATSMPAETAETNRPWQKTMGFVNALEQGKVSDEEFAVLKRLVEKRSREAAQAQVTVTPVDTVQHCSPCTQTPGWYGSYNARTAVSPEREDMGDRKNHRRRLLDRERGFKSKGKHFFTHGTRGHHQKYDNICRHLFINGTRRYASRDSCDPGKTQAQDLQRREQAV